MKLKKIRPLICAVLGVCTIVCIGNGIAVSKEVSASEDSVEKVKITFDSDDKGDK